LGQTTRSDILFAVHQIAKYASDPRLGSTWTLE
jgi:hypothetical protein